MWTCILFTSCIIFEAAAPQWCWFPCKTLMLRSGAGCANIPLLISHSIIFLLRFIYLSMVICVMAWQTLLFYLCNESPGDWSIPRFLSSTPFFYLRSILINRQLLVLKSKFYSRNLFNTSGYSVLRLTNLLASVPHLTAPL